MPFRSRSQMEWMLANEPEMARRWAKHTPDIEDLPWKTSKKDESRMRDIFEIRLEDDPELDPDEREELHSQLGGYELEPGEDAPEEPEGELVPEPEVMTPEERARRQQMMLAALEAEPEGEPTPEEPAPEEAPAIRRPAARPAEYSGEMKSLATRDPELYDVEYKQARADIGDYTDEINQLHDEGHTFGRIASIINDRHGLRTRPGPQRRKSRPGARPLSDLKCPECGGPVERTQSSFLCNDPGCGHEVTRALTPEQVATYLKLSGRMTRGPASRAQDLGSRMEHDHDPDTWDENCPACNWSTGFTSEPGGEPGLADALRQLGQEKDEFTTSEAIERAAGLESFKTDIQTPYFEPCPRCGDTRRRRTRGGDLACRSCGLQFDIETMELPKFYQKRGYSDVKLPKNFRNLADLVTWTLKNSPEFEPVDDWSKKMWTTHPLQVRWRYVGSGGEGQTMENLYEMFGEAIARPPGSKPFQDWNKLGQFGQRLKQAADEMQGNTYQTQDGQLLFYKDQMQTGEQPMAADVTQGVWSPVGQQVSTVHPNQQQSTPQMGSVFASKAGQ